MIPATVVCPLFTQYQKVDGIQQFPGLESLSSKNFLPKNLQLICFAEKVTEGGGLDHLPLPWEKDCRGNTYTNRLVPVWPDG